MGAGEGEGGEIPQNADSRAALQAGAGGRGATHQLSTFLAMRTTPHAAGGGQAPSSSLPPSLPRSVFLPFLKMPSFSLLGNH